MARSLQMLSLKALKFIGSENCVALAPESQGPER